MIPEDAFLSRYEKVKDAFQALFPDDKDFASRIKLITTLNGRAPNLYKLYGAFAQWEILDAMENNRDIDWKRLDVVLFLTSYAPSLKGRHAERAVEIAREGNVTVEKTVMDRLLGRE